MVTHSKRRRQPDILQWGLLLLCGLVLVACDQSSTFEYWHDRDHWLDQDEFSVTVSWERGVWVSGWAEHSSGTRVEAKNDYWRATWKVSDLKESSSNPPVKAAYVGRFEERRERGVTAPTHQSGLNLEYADFTGLDHLLVRIDDDYVSPKVPLSEPLGMHGKVTLADAKTKRFLTRSRKHLLIWNNALTIHETGGLMVVQEIQETAALAELRRLRNSAVGIHCTFLTNDLRYLVVIPHNGNDSPQGHNHHRAWCYDIQEARFFEKSFQVASGDRAVVSAEVWQERLHFFIYSEGKIEGKKMEIFDVDSRLIGRVSSDKVRRSYVGWDAANHLLWFAEGALGGAYDRSIALTKMDYAAGTSTKYLLKTGKLKAP